MNGELIIPQKNPDKNGVFCILSILSSFTKLTLANVLNGKMYLIQYYYFIMLSYPLNCLLSEYKEIYL